MAGSITLTECYVLVDDEFPPSHKGIRFTKDLSNVDVMDVLTFVSSTYGSARVMKATQFAKLPMVPVVWDGSVPKRKRDMCTTRTMLNVLALSTKPEAAVIFQKITRLTSITVTREQVDPEFGQESADVVVENLEASNTKQFTATTDAVVPYMPLNIVSGMYAHHLSAFGDQDKTKEFMRETITTAIQLDQCRIQAVYDENAHKKRMHEMQNEDAVDENAHKKRLREAREIQEKIKFFKSIGDELRAEQLMARYADL